MADTVTVALLGAALCPTDPVLATNVVSGKPAERDIPLRNRQLISLESGANDGLGIPLEHRLCSSPWCWHWR